MYDQIKGNTLYIMLYAAVMTMAVMACCYLLFRKANAIAPDVTPPARLRRWSAAFFAALALNHVWYMPLFFLTSSDAVLLADLIGGLLDTMSVFPLAIMVMLVMLQDRRRPLWPVIVVLLPVVLAGAWCVVTRSYAVLPVGYVCFVLVSIGLIIYMIHALRQYGRWLRDNFSDLEHKEVWQSFVVLAIVLLVFVVYALTNENQIFIYVMLAVSAVLICYLLWRVETLSDLSFSQSSINEEAVTTQEQTTHNDYGPFLQKYCIDTQLYLQHDLTLLQLSKAIGTNRFYLSQYFSSQGTTYNAYINNLRVDHFVSLYREALASQRYITAQQLAQESGFRSYSTFCRVIKVKTGKSVTAWMKDCVRA